MWIWIVVFVFFGPFIYPIVDIIADSISDKANEIKRKKYHGEKELIYVTTYQNNNLSKEDIMNLFLSQYHFYRQRYFVFNYKVFSDKDKQNYAWSIKTTKQTYGWGVVYHLTFHFSNGWFYISFSNNQFSSEGKSSQKYYYFSGYDCGTNEIETALRTCKEEAEIMWKINRKDINENEPFNFIPLKNNTKSYRENTRKQKESSYENSSIPPDLVDFYRKLLGLKLCFSQKELKNAYHEAVGKYHPDRYGTSSSRDRENAEMLMKQVNEAYEKLKEIAI